MCTWVVSVFVKSLTSEAWNKSCCQTWHLTLHQWLHYHDSQCVLLMCFPIQSVGIDVNNTSLVVNGKTWCSINFQISRDYFIDNIIVNTKVLIDCSHFCYAVTLWINTLRLSMLQPLNSNVNIQMLDSHELQRSSRLEGMQDYDHWHHQQTQLGPQQLDSVDFLDPIAHPSI